MAEGAGHGSEPVVSVVLPVSGEAPHLALQLAALARQDVAEPWELVVVEDRLAAPARRLVDAWSAPRATLTRTSSSAPGCAAARNTGIWVARAELLAFCDDDDVVADDWLRRLRAALAHHELVAGHLHELGTPPDPAATLPVSPAGFLPHAVTANCGARRAVFARVGGFDQSLRRFSDTDFSWRAQLAGVELVLERQACVAKRPRATLRAAFIQTWSWGRAEALLYRRYRPHGMRRDDLGTALRDAAHQARAAVTASDPASRRHAVRRLGWRLGRWAGSLRRVALYP